MDNANIVIMTNEKKWWEKLYRLNFRDNMSEHDEQAALFHWAAINQDRIPEFEMLYAIPNGGKRNIRVAQKLKAEGVKAGVWDIALDIPKSGYHGFRGEMKFGKNKLTKLQDKWGQRYDKWGYIKAVAYSWQEMAKYLLEYLGYDPREFEL